MSLKKWGRSLALAGCVSGMALAPLSQVEAAPGNFLTVKGRQQGQLRGAVTQKGREGSIEIYGFSHQITAPRDAASGLPTGKRQHKPFVVTKPVDKASAFFKKALAAREVLPLFELKVFGPGPKGGEALAYTVKLTDARVTSIRTLVGEDGKKVQELGFAYKKLELIPRDGLESDDDWEPPPSQKPR